MPRPGSLSVFRKKLNKAAREVSLRASVGRSDAVVERLGTEYGGWWVPTEVMTGAATCYSFGLGEDASFDLALIERFGTEVWSFDPTPRAIEFAKTIEVDAFHFSPVGVWSENREMRFYEPQDDAHVSHSITNEQGTSQFFVAYCQTTRTIMQELGHGRVDLIKMDIEGAEAVVIEDLISHGPHPRVLLIECDHQESPLTMLRRIAKLRRLGYQPVKSEGLTITLVLKGSRQPAA